MKIMLHLSNGETFIAEYEEDGYDDIYDLWSSGDKTAIAFENCVFRSKEIIGMEYIS